MQSKVKLSEVFAKAVEVQEQQEHCNLQIGNCSALIAANRELSDDQYEWESLAFEERALAFHALLFKPPHLSEKSYWWSLRDTTSRIIALALCQLIAEEEERENAL